MKRITVFWIQSEIKIVITPQTSHKKNKPVLAAFDQCIFLFDKDLAGSFIFRCVLVFWYHLSEKISISIDILL